MNIKVFIGPTDQFKKMIPIDRTASLLYLVTAVDLLYKGDNSAIFTFDTLIAHSDEYAGVNDHLIEGFLNSITFYQKTFKYSEVYLHNPPKKIVEQLKNSNYTVEFEKYNYTKLSVESLREIKSDFDQIVFGQEHVKSEILQTLYPLTNRHTGKPHNPVVFMLYGPPGVGKTETAKFINKVLNGKKILRRQMSMLHNNDSYSYIFGDKAHSFAKDLVDRETNVLLLDEFDKANPLFYNAFYQMFDEGQFEDKNYIVDISEAIIFCTSNYQSEKEIKNKLGPALYSRFDNVIPYKPLSDSAKLKILELTYEAEMKKYLPADQEYIKEQDLIPKMIKNIKSFENAREIQKSISKLMAYPLIKRI